jgi:N-dimethylarginine dimethylaminohydrolase
MQRKVKSILTTAIFDDPIVSLGKLDMPVYAMVPPLGFHANNVENNYMRSLSDEDRKVDKRLYLQQWGDIYSYLAANSLVYLIPNPNEDLPDLTYCSNIGVCLDDVEDGKVFIASNFSAKSRTGETAVGYNFFKSMGYEVHECPYKFEGSADMKQIKPGVWVGGYGVRTEKEAYDWMEEKFGIKIIKVKMLNDDLYHLDCCFMPITKLSALCCKECFSKKDIETIEEETGIYLYNIPLQYAEYGGTSCIRMYNSLLFASSLDYEIPGTEEYEIEKGKCDLIEEIASEEGLEIVYFDMSEGWKAGADMSCSFLEINRNSFKIDLQ